MTPLPSHLNLLLETYEFPGIPELDLSLIESEWMRFKSSIPEPWKLATDGREYVVGEKAKERGLSTEFPVVLVPGVVSTGLESWTTSPEYRSFFREKLWGGFHMISQVTLNRDKWVSALLLDPVTGIDPPGIKLRAAQGIDAASSFVQGYWIWSKIIQNLAVVNYDTNNLHLAAYDWRVSLSNQEVRDGFYSRLKGTIEGFKKRQGKKVVLVGHSMGSTGIFILIIISMKWVEAEGYGDGGPTWVEDHIESFVSIAGTHLVKAMTAFLSGEMRDTVTMSPAGQYVLERFFSRKERARLFRSWAGSASMWIKGGSAIWGNESFAPDDLPGHIHTHGKFLSFRHLLEGNGGAKAVAEGREDGMGERTANLTVDEASNWILEHTPGTFQRMLATNYSYGIERSEEQLKVNDQDPTKWSNPLEVRLPNAPSMKLYCVYGHGKETERSYWYARGSYEPDEISPDTPSPQCSNSSDCTERTPLDLPLARAAWIDAEFTDEKEVPKVKNGVKLGEGDGTVSLISLGGMCVEGWKRRRWNPGGVKIITHELPHQPSITEPRGGANTSDHVDILGSNGANEIIVKVATGAGHEVEDRFVSPIREYAARMRWD
ncbi:phospholipid diacylglycerol acyltransferase [Sistotremastrum niveocremeum HHB9708]|uniref:Phospholipid diacylglycerol acyltransferase n=1 Tax=Sistotremastrum niveocremeum HHB9708 TaxID=1314777 RepID=A0A164PNX1_9AGAM|nr:phospholipid diacylglycerol acyltransferase [Sistotremastrum niveocremeum HHB9708]